MIGRIVRISPLHYGSIDLRIDVLFINLFKKKIINLGVDEIKQKLDIILRLYHLLSPKASETSLIKLWSF